MKLDKFINRPVLSTVISILIVILGVIGLATLPVTQYPDIAPPTVSVRATYTGANAQTVLNSVIAPLEDQINGVENMMYIQSSASNNGSADISIYFNQGTDPDMAAVNVQNRVSMAQGLLPAEVTKVGVTTQKRQNSMLLIFSLYDAEDKYNIEFIENYAKINLIPEVQRVKGVGDANVMGQDYSMRIWLKPDVMAQYNLVPSDISGVLAEQNIEAAPGQFGERGNQTFQYTIRYKGRLQQTEEFEDIVVKALPNGEVLRLGDVARIELGRLAYTFNNTVNGHKAVTCIVFQMAGTNATETINNLLDVISKAEESLPAGLKINVAQNANDFLYASIHEVIKTLIEAFVLVFIVVYVFLQDMRSTLIPAIAIPVALIATFFVLKLIGFSVNLLTLSAMVLAIAIVVDDAIVVVEGVHAKLDQGYKSSREASIDAMSELGGALVSITLVMMSVFIPVSFMGGTAGTFYRQFGITMAISIAFSALNALTLSPALCAIFLKPHDSEHKQKKMSMVDRFHTSFNAAYDSLLKSYKKRVVFFIHKKWLSFGLVAASIVLLMFFMKTTPTGMVPNEDTGTIMGAVTLPPGTSQERAMEVLAKVDSLVAAEPAVQSRTIISGYSFIGGQGPSYGSVIIKLKDWEERSMMQNSDIIYSTLFLRAQKVIKDAQVLFFAPPMIPGYSVSSDIELNMQDKTGGTLDHFFEVVKSYTAALEARPEINSAKTTFNPSFPQYQLDIDAAACKKAGISPSDILSTMQGYFGGLYASNFNRFGKMYRVMIQAEPDATKNMESLNGVKVRGSNGEMAPITQFVSMKKVYGPDIINRFNLYTSMKVMVAPASGYTSGQALQAIAEVAKENLPMGFGYELGGMAREEAQTSGSTTGIIFVLCFVFVYLLLSAQYESYILPLAVLLSVPFGLMGSFIFVNGFSALGSIPALKMILGTMSNDIYMQIALIMLMGLLAKNAILIVEFALDRRKQGMSISWAAVLGAAARLRPILMTSLAMIVGLIPLMLAMGVGAHGNRTLGASAIGGMLIGMIFQIFIVPVLFVVFQWLQEKVKPMEWDSLDESEVEAEIEQYSPNTHK
ncbi:efflux RND transporter permease subunit [Phocaeicola plebeius]|jgi:HAE1 family hydrophobic/amphiphilic exporter-1|uniref:AcrB/AcrD/AcrF family protein n=1 Tax=Phocaeicola plebeius TaxID=310297 RepID=A0A3E4WIY8_9BACT|nr:efflux RND transporter permease subunit [Phocaeicola plebeius]HBV18265.1 hydrophobe/amphiphile efflux-1 family RND transporter [Bacteroides sp.]RGK57777.1 AcrB/AcrD/AcrF family protein [Phocaeicola plebeius]RGM42010.1 AcrB/AcrD/AcrF family protein [Phocaeicola plebeius]RGQ75504.1 AcrB/AcrD/AcrF family protein [Phocaeicola plebeius]RGQ95644.1 AcrB/AcrD/AcrF family protein [Phocaeicola plebeius]